MIYNSTHISINSLQTKKEMNAIGDCSCIGFGGEGCGLQLCSNANGSGVDLPNPLPEVSSLPIDTTKSSLQEDTKTYLFDRAKGLECTNRRTTAKRSYKFAKLQLEPSVGHPLASQPGCKCDGSKCRPSYDQALWTHQKMRSSGLFTKEVCNDYNQW